MVSKFFLLTSFMKLVPGWHCSEGADELFWLPVLLVSSLAMMFFPACVFPLAECQAMPKLGVFGYGYFP